MKIINKSLTIENLIFNSALENLSKLQDREKDDIKLQSYSYILVYCFNFATFMSSETKSFRLVLMESPI